jgi:uncharacterized HAD superfamily protein/orotate phosphoribosyltransferase
MFGYLSVAQLSAAIRAKLTIIPDDIDLVVGIPRSGMIPAYLIGLFLNRLVVDLETFLNDGPAPGHGARRIGAEIASPLDARHVLLVDDSLASGASMKACIGRIGASRFAGRVTSCAVVVEPSMAARVDLHFVQMPQPRVFEWNAFHHPYVEMSCFDLDGLLCADPTPQENDDGSRYRAFLRSTPPLFRPTRRIGHIVSARLEKYRPETEAWLAAHGIGYGALHLIDLPSRAERMRLGTHHRHKARVFRESGSVLFYESDPDQAQEIARLAGKPVLCVADMDLRLPDGFQVKAHIKNAKWRLRRPLGRFKGQLREKMRVLVRTVP